MESERKIEIGNKNQNQEERKKTQDYSGRKVRIGKKIQIITEQNWNWKNLKI